MKLNSIKLRIILLGIVGVVVLAGVISGVMIYKKKQIARMLNSEFQDVLRRTSDVAAHETYVLCRAQNDLLQEQLRRNLKIASNALERAGGIRLSTQSVQWTAVNQFTKDSQSVSLPLMNIGQTELSPNANAEAAYSVVDSIKETVGCVCTVFQRINDAGDMLRVCTNVQKKDGSRAVGTFIPAIGTDEDRSAVNPVVAALLRGEAFHGPAFVVDAWYLAAYAPVFDGNKKVIGALFVGIRQDEALAPVRQGIIEAKVGKSGYAFVLGGKGARQGRYIISKDGKRDGENLWEAKDANGKYFIQEIVKTGLASHGGSVGMTRYAWKNSDDKQARMKLTAVTYFEPWDWVIGAGTYEDDVTDAQANMVESFNLNEVIIGALVLCLAIGVIAYVAAANITKPIIHGVGLLNQISQGDLTQDVPAKLLARRDEVGELAAALARLCASLRLSLLEIFNCRGTLSAKSHGLLTVSRRLSGAARNTSERSQTVAAAAEEASANTGSVAASMEQASTNLASVASATEELSATVADIAANSEKARTISEGASAQAQAVSTLVHQLGQAAQEIGKVTEAITNISDQTNLLALNATIEAARAGAAGKGFAVVAHEIKELARQTAGATEDIKTKVTGVQNSTGSAIADIEKIAGTIKEVGGLVANIAAAIEEQATVTKDVARNISEASAGVKNANERVAQTAAVSKSIAQDIAQVSVAGSSMTRGSTHVQNDAGLLGNLTDVLKQIVDSFNIGKHVEFDAIKKAHLEWRDRIMQMFDGESKFSAADAGDFHKCAFGKWYDHEARERFQHLPAYATVGAQHQAFHGLVADIVQLWEAGRTEEATRKFESVTPQTDKLFDLLDQLSMDTTQAQAQSPVSVRRSTPTTPSTSGPGPSRGLGVRPRGGVAQPRPASKENEVTLSV